MLTGLPALESTDWSSLYHAYGRASDTPAHLRALIGDNEAARKKALSHLSSAVMHQGTPWTVTGPAALVVAGLLSDQRIQRDESLRVQLLSFLVSVALAAGPSGESIQELERLAEFDTGAILDAGGYEELYENEDAALALHARAKLGCIRAAPKLMEVMQREMAHPSARVRAHAAMGAVTLAKIEFLRGHTEQILSRLLTLSQDATDSDERSAHVLALGELGISPAAFLRDPSPAVRMCAALAPGMADDLAATDELLRALEGRAGDIDGWFVERPPQFDMHPRFSVVARLVERVDDFQLLAKAAVAVAGMTHKYCVDNDWGPLLAKAFPDGRGQITTEAQRDYLEALVNNSKLWDPRFGNPLTWFKAAGLPYDRQACSQIVNKASREVEPGDFA